MELFDNAKKRSSNMDADLRMGFKLNDATVLPNDGSIITHGERRHLPPKAMQILLYMSKNSDTIIESNDLLMHGWGDSTARRSNLTHVISEIRYALDDHKECPEHIQTIPRKGYRLNSNVQLLDDKIVYPDVWPLKKQSSLTQASLQNNNHWQLSIALLKNSRLFRVSAAFVITTWVVLQVFELLFPIFNIPSWGLKIAVLVLVIGFPLALLFTWIKDIKIKKLLLLKKPESIQKKHFIKQIAFDFSLIGLLSIGVGFISLYLIDSIETEKNAPTPKTQNITLTQPIKDNLIAVLPFQFKQVTSLPEYFKATFQAEIINALSQQGDFNLVSQRAINELSINSSMSDYVERLGARYLLDGKITENDKGFSILLSLTDTQSSLQVWSTIIKGFPAEVLIAQKELYRQSFSALALLAQRPSNSDHQVINTTDFKAYDSYIQGKNQLAIASTEAQLQTAEMHFLNSLNHDPKFTLASAGLCQTYLDQYELSRLINMFQSAKQHCSALLTISLLKEEAFVSLGNLNRISGKHTEAIEFYNKALLLNRDNLNAISGTALSNSQLGNDIEAEKLLLKTIQLEPGYWKNYLTLGDFLFTNGKYKDATEQYAKVTLLRPNDEQGFNRLGASFYLDDQIEAASVAWQRSLDIKPSASNYSNLGTALFDQRKFTLAKNSYEKALAIKASDPTLWANLADAQKFSGLKNESKTSYKAAIDLAGEQLLVNPHDQTLLGMRARYQSELGDCSSSSNTSKSLIAKKITDPYLYYDLSIAAVNCGQLEQAKILIRQAVELGYSEKLVLRDIQFSKIDFNDLTQQQGK